MPSKGVDSYTFLTKSDSSVHFSVPKNEQAASNLNQMLEISQQVDSSNISGLFNYTGPYKWQALLSSDVVGEKTNQINSLTGNLESGSQMADMMNMPAIIQTNGDNFAISYGFYDAGPGTSGLTNHDQCYAYFTDSYENWMAGLAAAMPDVKDKPFHQFCLSGAHDAGMNTMATVDDLIDSPVGIAIKAALVVAFPVLGTIAALNVKTAIRNLAITQKDSFTNMLNLGTRYFDFRPGYLYSKLRGSDNTLYHQHSVIPGAKYQDFLVEVLQWLDTHPTEIVVVDCNTSGFAEDSMKPTPQDLDAVLASAREQANVSTSAVVAGGLSDVSSTYQQLLDNKTRLIFLNQIDGETTKYDSYSDSAYATLNPQTIISAIAQMSTMDQAKYDYSVVQIQGTSTNINDVAAASVVSSSDTSSPLMATKAAFDNKTLPWLLANLQNHLSNQNLTIVLNDFIDNATASHSISLTKQRT